jgi:hypothetical protein
MSLETFKYGGTWVLVRPGYVSTVLPDGATVVATPNHTPEDVERAHRLGYAGDVVAMTRDHDRFHALLAHALGLKESPALRDVANGATSEIGCAEEDMVLAAQRFLNMCRKAGKL